MAVIGDEKLQSFLDGLHAKSREQTALIRHSKLDATMPNFLRERTRSKHSGATSWWPSIATRQSFVTSCAAPRRLPRLSRSERLTECRRSIWLPQCAKTRARTVLTASLSEPSTSRKRRKRRGRILQRRA